MLSSRPLPSHCQSSRPLCKLLSNAKLSIARVVHRQLLLRCCQYVAFKTIHHCSLLSHLSPRHPFIAEISIARVIHHQGRCVAVKPSIASLAIHCASCCPSPSIHCASCPSPAAVPLQSLCCFQDHPSLPIAKPSIAKTKTSIHCRDLHRTSCPSPRLLHCHQVIHCCHIASLAVHCASCPPPSCPLYKLSISCSANCRRIVDAPLISVPLLSFCSSPSCHTAHRVSCPFPSDPLHKLAITGRCCVAITTLHSRPSIAPHCQAGY